MDGSKVIRVDPEVYQLLLLKQHELERRRGRQVRMSDAVRAALEEEESERETKSD